VVKCGIRCECGRNKDAEIVQNRMGVLYVESLFLKLQPNVVLSFNSVPAYRTRPLTARYLVLVMADFRIA